MVDCYICAINTCDSVHGNAPHMFRSMELLGGDVSMQMSLHSCIFLRERVFGSAVSGDMHQQEASLFVGLEDSLESK